MSQSWRALRLRDAFDTPSKHGVVKAWSPAGKNEGWRDYANYAPELREWNTQKKALRSNERGESRLTRSRSPEDLASNGLGRSSSRASDDSLPGSWRLSYRASISRRTLLQLKQQRAKRVGQLPVFPGMATFTLRNMGITHLDGLGVHPEVTKIFLQQNFLTSFEGWEHQPNLVELHASDNCIESFKGFTASTTLERIFLQGNPIAHCYHYRLMAIAACGKTLRMIDSEPVRKLEAEHALELGKDVADAIRHGWILDNMPNADADVDLLLEDYLYYKKYGVLPESARPTSPDEARRQRSTSSGRGEATRHRSATKSPQNRVKSHTPMRKSSSSQSVWKHYDDDDDDETLGDDSALPRGRRDGKYDKSRSPEQRTTRLSEQKGPDVEGKTAPEDPEGYGDLDRANDHVKQLLKKLLTGAALDDQLKTLLKLQGSLNEVDLENDESYQVLRLRQTDADAFDGWRNVQEMTMKLIDDVNALEKRVENRRHVDAVEPRRPKPHEFQRRVTPESDVQEQSEVEKRIDAGLRNSLLGTSGEPRTSRCLKRAVLEQWARVLEEFQDQGPGPSRQKPEEEETVRMILDLDFSKVKNNLDGFRTALETDLKNALGIDGDGIRVCKIEAGSVIATLGFLPVADGRSAMELVDTLKAQAADPASTLRSGVYTRSVRSLTHVSKRGSSQRTLSETAHRPTVLSKTATPINKPSPQSVANAALRAQEFEKEREEMQRLASEWQIRHLSPQPGSASSVSPKPSTMPTAPVEDIEAEEAALMRRLAEVQEKKKKHQSSAENTPQMTPQANPESKRKAHSPPASASPDVGSADVKAAAEEVESKERKMQQEREEAAAVEAKRLEIETRMRKQWEEEERMKKEVEEKLRKEKQLEDQLKREVEKKMKREFEEKMRREEMERNQLKRELEEKLKSEFEEKMLREEMERNQKAEEERAKKAAEERIKREEEEKMRREADERKRREEERARQRREEELRREKEETERRLAEERKEQERKEQERKEQERQREAEELKKRERERLEAASENKSQDDAERKRKDEDMKKGAEEEARRIEYDRQADEEKRRREEESCVAFSPDRQEQSQEDSKGETQASMQSSLSPSKDFEDSAAENDRTEDQELDRLEQDSSFTGINEMEGRKEQETLLREEELRAQEEEERKAAEERIRRENEEKKLKQQELRKKCEEEERKAEEERIRREEKEENERTHRLEQEEQDRKEAARQKEEEKKQETAKKAAEEDKRRAEAAASPQCEADKANTRSERGAQEDASVSSPPTNGHDAHKDIQDQRSSQRSNSPSDSTAGETSGEKEKKKKKKKQDDLDAEGRPLLLKNCEIRGEPIEGEKMTAFAKRAKKIEISCTFQWYRALNGKEQVIAGADKASYVVSMQDVGHLLKVVGLPIVKETNEHGQPVSATTSKPVLPMGTTGNSSNEGDHDQPRLTDWKIEMNPRQEYVDPIRMHYTYTGGVEGCSIVQWFREVNNEETGAAGEDGFEEIVLKDPSWYQPYVDDVNKRIKLLLTPVRNDGVHGPTYQHIIDCLTLPYRLQEDVKRCTQEFRSRGANFLLAQVDLVDPTRPPRNMRIVCVDKQLKVRNADTDKTEVKVKLGSGCVRVQAHEEIQRLFTATFTPPKTNSNPITYHFLADSMRSRDIIVLTLRALAKSDP